MKRHLSSVAWLLVILAGLYVANCIQDRGVAERARLEMKDVVHDTMLVRLRADSIRRAASEARMADSAARLRTHVVHIRAQLVDKQRRADSLVALVRSYDSLVPRPVVDSLLAATDSVTSGLLVQIVSLDSQVRLYQAMYESADSARTLLHHALHESDALRVAWRKQARPGLLTQARRALPWALAAVVVWEAVR